jgi:hypothetical protein
MMAKLKARGRTEVFRVEKNYVKHIGQITERTRHQLAVMSDGNVLIKRRDTWTVSGKVPPDKTAEEILAGYLADNWTLVSESPQYLVRRGHTIEDVSKVPLLTSSKASAAARAHTKIVDKNKAADLIKNGPGLYVTYKIGLSTSPLLTTELRDAKYGPYQDYDFAEEKAWKLYQNIVRQHGPRSLNLPVAIIEATSRTDAKIDSGHVWWTDGKFRGAPVDPRQMRFAAERF